MNNPLKIAVIGYGHLGKWHCDKVEAIKQSTLYAIVDRDQDMCATAAAKHPSAKVVSDIAEVIDDIDAAIVVTPTSTHFHIVKNLLDHGKHVFCEKPLCERDFQALDLQRIVEMKGLKLQVGHSERCHKAWEMIKKHGKYFESPYCVQMNRLAPFKNRATDVDVVQDLMIHDIDLLLYLFDELPRSVHAVGHKICTEKWDFVCATFKFSSGSKAVITVGRNHVKELRDFVLTNTNGCIAVDLVTNKIYRTDNNRTTAGEVKESDYEKRDHLFMEQDAFYRSITKDDPIMVTAGEGAEAIRLVNKVLESLENNQEVSI